MCGYSTRHTVDSTKLLEPSAGALSRQAPAQRRHDTHGRHPSFHVCAYFEIDLNTCKSTWSNSQFSSCLATSVAPRTVSLVSPLLGSDVMGNVVARLYQQTQR
mmetsp:Transcript_21217/g.36140  ORF Transcript_21217/g.36140 Transcript_21217/m.36140 type:complete len:103 (-) Transcript_21217:1707-2015(-)